MKGQHRRSSIRYEESKLWDPEGIPGLWVPKTVSSILQLAFCILIFLLPVAGCQEPYEQERALLMGQIAELTTQKTQLAEQTEQFKSENEQLKEQVQVLSGLPADVRLPSLCRAHTVKIGRLTNLLDKDKDGKYEKLVVYIQPMDEDGDKVKVSGTADVELWDLNEPDGRALLGRWQVGPDELKKHWVAFVVINYRLTFDVSDKIDTYKDPLTVKVTFTDYLTGRVFREQRVIKPLP